MGWDKLGKPIDVKNLSQAERDRLEASYTFRRITELELDPVQGNFDAAHLKEVNRRIFQDLPALGFDDVTPGEYRPQVPAGKDWIKTRTLETVPNSEFVVAYSRMDKSAQAQLDRILKDADPDKLRGLKTAEYVDQASKLYANLDYIHPFRDGNSRTLRTFTAQLARAAGYDIDWSRFGRSPGGRDVLYIARDLSVNKLAEPHVQHQDTRIKIVYSMDRLAGNRDLRALVRDVVRPGRAIAFEQMSEAEALHEYPELAPAYKTLRAASEYALLKIPGDSDARQQAIESVAAHIQYALDKGETNDFKPGRSEKQADVKAHVKPGPEQER